MVAAMSSLPILYSFRRCPYAIRARLAVYSAELQVELREVVLKEKPSELLSASPKGTVPVLVLPDGCVIEESLDIMKWALAQRDPLGLQDTPPLCDRLIERCDKEFKGWLDRYKYADRHPEQSQTFYRQQAESFLAELEEALLGVNWLGGPRPIFADLAIFPFIRQFAGVEPKWWVNSEYSSVRRWLSVWLENPMFLAVMYKYPAWNSGDTAVYFPQ